MERIAALCMGYTLDLLLGDPLWMPHPVVAMGKAISRLEKLLRRLFPKTPAGELAGGAMLAGLLPSVSFGAGWVFLWLMGRVHPIARLIGEAFLCYQVLATKCLRDAVRPIFKALKESNLPAARLALGQVVGRETKELDREEILRGVVETVAENTSDGVVAPMLFFALGGAPLALAYKAVNTMDSMLGYKNERYLYFGRWAARLDDLANWIPARLTALLMIPAAALTGLDAGNAYKIWRRDHRRHTSPNAPHPEAACAGALGVQLGGNARYFGQMVEKETLGDPLRPLEEEDIPRTCRLLYATSFLCLLLCLGGLVLIW
ncbi:adenosylcobinamide-phosphate synthase CbiB [Oscillospiraceae bacterium MB08-C2-2]|nr:adenosylcobinamide-phosphate synthase CbiB [Oscillospiraceae bacterium MB08-C2-2]